MASRDRLADRLLSRAEARFAIPGRVVGVLVLAGKADLASYGPGRRTPVLRAAMGQWCWLHSKVVGVGCDAAVRAISRKVAVNVVLVAGYVAERPARQRLAAIVPRVGRDSPEQFVSLRRSPAEL